MNDEELRALLGNEQQLTEDPFGGQPQTTEQVPERPTEPAAPSAFSFAPAAAGAETPAAEVTVPPRPERHTFLYFMLTLLVFGVLAFSVYCVIKDVRSGTTSGGYRAGNIVRVELVQHRRDATPDRDADENGRYSYAGIAQAVMPSIVEIYTYKDGTMGGTGSGIILSEDGYIATNAHVLEDASSYSVKLFDESQQDVQ
ncbi:MAG: serine protease, partial [Oscillospiraceae bacterium]|nr:serine protease [Oscillospiraceae bacterium]